MSKAELNSSLQKNFITQSTFKRNTRYYDVPTINGLENQYQIKRRKPIYSPKNSQKLQNAFTNSTAALSSKLDIETSKYRNRLSIMENKSEYERENSSPGSPKLKSFSIGRMTARDYHHNLKNKPIEDQRLFNNFKIQKHDLSKTCDFSKLQGRKFDFELKHLNDIYHESQKPYEQFYYHATALKQKVNYKRENKQQGRYFFRSKRKEDFPSTVMDPEKVDIGHKIATNFKGSNIKRSGFSPFYLETGRQFPSNFDMRSNTSLTNYRRSPQGNLVKPDLDYTVKKMKQQMLNAQQEKLRKAKKPEFTRNQLCDYRYFKANATQNKNNE